MKILTAIKRELLADPATRSAYDAQAGEFDMARELIAARARAGLTQCDVAELMGTTQSVIARLEGDRARPRCGGCCGCWRDCTGPRRNNHGFAGRIAEAVRG